MKVGSLSLALLLSLTFTCPTFAGSGLETGADIGVSLLPITALGAILYLDDKEGSWQLAKGFATNLAITEVLKQSVQRERPNKEDDKSFPSGHTSVSFQAATFIYQRYGWKPAIPAYITASFVGYSRIKTDWHYGTDVLAGAIIGSLTSLYFTSPWNDSIQFMPIVDAGTYGIALNGTW